MKMSLLSSANKAGRKRECPNVQKERFYSFLPHNPNSDLNSSNAKLLCFDSASTQ